MAATLKRLVYFFPFLGIILISFFLASPLFTPWYNSDHAIHVLMIEKFNWSADWYYWGQDRLGSWIPLFGQLFNKVFQFNAIWSASLALYFTLIFGFYFFQSFIKSFWMKVILCVAYFMPLALFNSQVFLGHPYSSQLLFIGGSIFLLRELKNAQTQIRIILIGFSLGLSFMASVWISDISLALFPFYLIFFLLDKGEIDSNPSDLSFKIKRLDFSIWYYLVPLLISIYLGNTLISMAKEGAIEDPRYAQLFADKNEIKQGIVLFLNTIQESLLFRVANVLVSFQTILLCLTLSLGLFFTFKNRLNPKQLRSFVFLGMTFFLLLLLLASNWVKLFNYDLRYFTIVYIFFICSLCFIWDLLEEKVRKIGTIILGIAVLIGATHFSISHSGDLSHTKKEITYKSLKKESKKLPPCTLIGSYWNGYNLASTQPKEIIAIPHEGHYARNIHELDLAFKKKNIFLISDDWFDEYPEETFQRGYFLKKEGSPFKLDIYTYCKYKVEKKYPMNNFEIILDGFEEQGSIYLKDSSLEEAHLKSQYLVLPKGKYHIDFEIESDDDVDFEGIVYYNYGKKNFLVKELVLGKNSFSFQVKDERGIFIMIKAKGLGDAKVSLGDIYRP